MKALIFAFCVVAAIDGQSAPADSWQPSAGHTQIPIWPAAAPDLQPVPGPETVTSSKELLAGKPVISVTNVTRPTITVYAPEGKSAGAAVLVIPGGGFEILAMDFEGTEICDWLTSKGITCVLLKYRVPSEPYLGKCACRPRLCRLCKTSRERCRWCAFTRRSGTSIRTRLACWGSRPADTWWDPLHFFARHALVSRMRPIQSSIHREMRQV